MLKRHLAYVRACCLPTFSFTKKYFSLHNVFNSNSSGKSHIRCTIVNYVARSHTVGYFLVTSTLALLLKITERFIRFATALINPKNSYKSL